MAERTTSPYQRLFEVRLLHHYWLDEGATVFDGIADQTKRDARLLAYDVRPLLAVKPTRSTEEGLRALGCLFRPTALGFIVAAPAAAVLPADTVFTFVLSIVASQVFDYTALTLRPQKIYELFDPTDHTAGRVTYRYKENVSVLSNLTGTTRGTGPNTALYLSREIPPASATDPIEAFVLSGGALLQLTSDNPSATTQQLSAQATNLPVYLNQADAPVIVPPAGVSGAPARGVLLSPDVPDDVFALISLTAVCPGNDTFSFVDAMGAVKPAAPVYQVRFKNRSTIWRYRDMQTGAVATTEANPLPLTYFGNAGTKQKPSRGIVNAEQSGAKITRLISEIYV
jgi:hypothetical protein